MKERLKMVRKALGFTQEEFAKELGIAQGTYSLFEKGKRVIQPRYIKMMRIQFDVNPEWMETGNGEMFLQSKDEDEFVKMLGELTEENKELVATFVEKLLKSQE